MSNVIRFVGSRPSRTDPYGQYLWALSDLQAEFPSFHPETMRRVVNAWDDYTAGLRWQDDGGAA